MSNPWGNLQIRRALAYSAFWFILFLLLGCQITHAQVYEVNIYSAGRTYDHQWLIGSPSNYYGFTQYREYQDEKGNVLMAGQQWRTARRATYTRIDLGQIRFTFPMPAWLVLGIGGTMVASLVVLIVRASKRARRLERELQHT